MGSHKASIDPHRQSAWPVGTPDTLRHSRFNLLREESEGFAKLLNALLRFEKVSMDPLHLKALVRAGALLFEVSHHVYADSISMHFFIIATHESCDPARQIVYSINAWMALGLSRYTIRQKGLWCSPCPNARTCA